EYEGKNGVLIIFQDISSRKRQEATLRRTKSRLIEAQKIAHLGNWDLDLQNDSLWISDETYRIWGIDPKDFDNKFESFCKYIHTDDRQHVKEINDNEIKQCKPFDLQFRIIRPDGMIRYVHKRVKVECVDQKPVRLVGTIQDITEQKKAENQIILSRQKLRTLAAKMEMIEEQERRRIASDLHDSVGQILAFATRELKYMRKNMPKKYGDSLLEIADQLDKAVVQTRTLSFDLSPSILYDIGFEIAVEDMLEKFSNENNIKYQFENDEKPKPLTIPLKILLYRSIRELLMNIAKHAKAKNVKVSLLRNDTQIEVIVEDDGKGFDVSEVEGGEKTKGFGLFNIRERIEHHGGKFKIESAKNKGSKIALVVPLTF
ncbi:MAG: ATP-binding protein, partial [Phycisphaerales bacterium]